MRAWDIERREMECVADGRNVFYTIIMITNAETEKSFVLKHWGAIGGRGQHQTMACATRYDAQDEFDKVVAQKKKKKYRVKRDAGRSSYEHADALVTGDVLREHIHSIPEEILLHVDYLVRADDAGSHAEPEIDTKAYEDMEGFGEWA